MPFNKEKTISLKDFLERVHARIKTENNPQVLACFEVYIMRNLAEKLVEEGAAVPEVAELDLMPGDFDSFYPFVAKELRDAASRNYSEVHLDSYQEAHAVSVAFCAELNEYFECSGEDGLYDLIPIVSFVEMLRARQTTQPSVTT